MGAWPGVARGALTDWAFEAFAEDGLVRLELLHQVDNDASCRVAESCGYGFAEVLSARPPWPREDHRPVRPGPGNGRAAAHLTVRHRPHRTAIP